MKRSAFRAEGGCVLYETAPGVCLRLASCTNKARALVLCRILRAAEAAAEEAGPPENGMVRMPRSAVRRIRAAMEDL